MSISSDLSTAGIYTDLGGVARLRARASSHPSEAGREVAQQFEALFLQIMLKSMRQGSLSGESGDSDQTRFYQELFDKQVALNLASGQGIGLAAILESKLGGISPSPAGHFAELSAAGSMVGHEEMKRLTTSPQSFMKGLWPQLSGAIETLGVSPEVLIAQSALETGWGKQMITGRNGEKSLNFFGIKADNSWKGHRMTVPTLEYRDGIARQELASFRAYGSLSESIDDYVRFLKGNPRYQLALDSVADADEFVTELQSAGFSTDPAYAKKIISIMNRDSFKQALATLRMEKDS